MPTAKADKIFGRVYTNIFREKNFVFSIFRKFNDHMLYKKIKFAKSYILDLKLIKQPTISWYFSQNVRWKLGFVFLEVLSLNSSNSDTNLVLLTLTTNLPFKKKIVKHEWHMELVIGYLYENVGVK